MRYIYLDNAATTKPCYGALSAFRVYSEAEFCNPASSHRGGIEARAALDDFRRRISRCINGGKGTVYFCSGGTEANNLAIFGVINRHRNKKAVLTTAFEHSSVLKPVKSLFHRKNQAIFALPDFSGTVSYQDFKNQNLGNFGLVSVMYANNVVGTLQPIAEIGALCKKAGVPFHSDAVQAMGHTDIDVERDNVDLLSFSGHKFGGVKGVGGLWVRNGIDLEPMLLGGGQEMGLRSGTVNLPGVAAMTVALEESSSCLPAVSERCRKLQDILFRTLQEEGTEYSVIGSGAKLPHIVNVAFEGVQGSTLQLLLSERGVLLSTGAACSSASAENYVLDAMCVPKELSAGSIRLSLSGKESEDDIVIAARAIALGVAALQRKN